VLVWMLLLWLEVVVRARRRRDGKESPRCEIGRTVVDGREAVVWGLELLVVLVWMLLLWLEVVVLVLLRWRAEDGGLCLRSGVPRDGGEDRRLGAPVRGVPLGRIKGPRDTLGSADDQRHVLDRCVHYVVRTAWLGFVDRGACVKLGRGRLPPRAGEGVMLLLGDGALVRGAPPVLLAACVTISCCPWEREAARKRP
jgi:hypothetical protein